MHARWHAEMRWEDVLFVHWPVDPAVLDGHVPEGLSLDTRDGRAWVSVVALVMADVGPPGVPWGYTFAEANLRTYVQESTENDRRERTGDDPAVYFLSVEAAEPVGTRAARLFGRASSRWRAPYHRARVTVERDGDGVSTESVRRTSDGPAAAFAATAQVGAESAFVPAAESLPGFLTDRYRFYAPIAGSDGRSDGDEAALAEGVVAHGPWRLRPASVTVLRDELFAAAGLRSPTTDPVAYYCAEMPSVAARLEPGSAV